ncbi:type II toxin-antitoxin system VapC family toxin [Flavobacterium marginilacus]|uniref:type II toxin-antitoxin system VapC family toxin n=1 Tax=Flavobacterium marginilacus TaxID=3003256 RepID=UPI00248F0A14|nr:type II toxin-antitoxin system VapC family toxin [Flavobacterium marginilacus]
MNLLLDTHTLLWYFEADEKLSEKAKTAIENPKNKIFISIAVIWELSIKVSINKINFEDGFVNFLKTINKNGIEILPISIESLIVLSSLEFIHRDPFDRIMIAQFIFGKLTFITKDEFMPKYDIKTIW